MNSAFVNKKYALRASLANKTTALTNYAYTDNNKYFKPLSHKLKMVYATPSLLLHKKYTCGLICLFSYFKKIYFNLSNLNNKIYIEQNVFYKLNLLSNTKFSAATLGSKALLASIDTIKNLKKTKSIIARRRPLQLQTVDSSTTLTWFIDEVEHLFGQPTVIRIRTIRRPSVEAALFVFKNDFCSKFAYVLSGGILDADMVYDVFAVFGQSHDLKMFVGALTTILEGKPFPSMQFTISNIKKMIRFFWYFWWRAYKAAGMYLTLSGKLSWHLLTISRTVSLRLGKTSASTVDLNALYQYKEYTSDTGAYGLTIRFYSRSIFHNKFKN